MNDDQTTPVARPCMNPENQGLAEALNRHRYAVEGYAARLGDIERTIRLSANRYGPEVGQGLGAVADDLSSEAKRAAQEFKEAS
jgi:hypothetical protein